MGNKSLALLFPFRRARQLTDQDLLFFCRAIQGPVLLVENTETHGLRKFITAPQKIVAHFSDNQVVSSRLRWGPNNEIYASFRLPTIVDLQQTLSRINKSLLLIGQRKGLKALASQ